MMQFINSKTVACALMWCSVAANASIVPAQSFFNEDTGANGFVTAGPLAARNAFLATLDGGVGRFGFESASLLAGRTAPFTVDFASSSATPITATVAGNGAATIRSTPIQGRYNTTSGGNKYLEVKAGDTGNFSISFSTAISAFGFYGNDIGDFGGTVKLQLTRASDSGIDEIDLALTGADANLMFYGFADKDLAYTKITFVTTSSSTSDFFGFDDFVVADRGQITAVIPEPTSLALTGLALAAAGFAARRTRRA